MAGFHLPAKFVYVSASIVLEAVLTAGVVWPRDSTYAGPYPKIPMAEPKATHRILLHIEKTIAYPQCNQHRGNNGYYALNSSSRFVHSGLVVAPIVSQWMQHFAVPDHDRGIAGRY